MKRLIFLTAFDYPSRYAHAIHGLHMARAFHQVLGGNFIFFVNTDVDGTLTNIPHRRLFGGYGRLVKKLHLRRALIPFVLWRFFISHFSWRGGETTLLINDPRLIEFAARATKTFGVRFIFESHGLLEASSLDRLARAAEKVVFTTTFLEQDALAKEPRLMGKTSVLTNAVDIDTFTAVPDNRSALRQELGLPEGLLLGYVGRFVPTGEDKGLRLMIDALAELPDTILVLVGGTKDEIAEYAAYAAEREVGSRVKLVPHVPGGEVPRYEKACDILAYVPSGGSAYFDKETSPMKVFEYMAAERPMVLSDLPTIRALVPQDAAYFVQAGSKDAFVAGVKEVFAAPREAARRAALALETVRANTWERRAARILAL